MACHPCSHANAICAFLIGRQSHTNRAAASRQPQAPEPALYSTTAPVHTVHTRYAQLIAVNPELFLSTTDIRPMYQQIVDQITLKVMAGDWPAGQSLPSIRELASASKVSVITVKRAYTELGLAGIIVTRHGMGSYVAESPDLPKALLRSKLQQHLQALLDCARQLGLSTSDIQQLIANTATSAASDSYEEPSS